MENSQHLSRLEYRQLLEESAENLYENAACGYATSLPDGSLVKMNRTLLRWLSYESEDLVNKKKFQDLLAIGGKIFYETHHAPLLAMQGFVQELSYDLQARDRTLVPVLVNAVALTNAAGVTLLHRFTIFNITDRHKYEEELLLAKRRAEQKTQELYASEEKLRQSLEKTVELGQLVAERELLLSTLANASPVALWMSDERGAISYVNATWVKWTGRPFDAHLGQGWSFSILEEDRQPILEAFFFDFNARRYFQADFRIRHQDGQVHWCVAEGVPRYSSNGNFAGYVGSCVDITERKRTEQQLQTVNEELAAISEELATSNEEMTATNQQLLKVNADLDNFVYTASHDLKAPITNLEGLLVALNRKIVGHIDEADKKIMELMYSSINKFKRTIAGLIDVTKAQTLEEEKQLVDIAPLAEEVKADLHSAILQTQAVIQHDFRVPQLRFARVHFQSILYNLLSNAIKYHSPDRTPLIHLHTYQDGAYTVLTVQDNGLGMNGNQQSKLFTLFKRFHNHVEGTGVGLYMIKRTIENNGGKIEVQSEEGKGSLFKVYFK